MARYIGPVTPGSDDALHAANGQGAKSDTKKYGLDSNFDVDRPQPFDSLKAQAAKCGCTLHELADGGYLLSRWNLCRAIPSLHDVRSLLERIGGRHHD